MEQKPRQAKFMQMRTKELIMEQTSRQAKFIQMRTRMDYGTDIQTSKIYTDENKNGLWNRNLDKQSLCR